ncbi:FHA domain-containing protein [Virgisporangium aurantiacum]|uniref:FHA domain-containing protein n=1 Tax=Virgisporangium aurantiacum TaxID=175570 RepID=A0A8J3ZD60_9ACTN|nr:FHA domain-containing protein [Virgisporangium aurantiacum]GIJ61771.1 hypothetical protein Vau01_092870 [Virgisporangium aurantiacum]
MPTCPRGHQSAANDYCDVCGRSMTAPPVEVSAPPVPLEKPTAAQPAADPDPGNACPLCGTPRAGRFCEVDGYDFMTATLMEDEPSVPSTPSVAPSATPPADAPPAAPPAVAPPAVVAPPAAVPEQRSADDGPATGVRVTADRGYFDIVRQAGGPDAGALAFPDFCPERRFPLRGSQVLIGRRSKSRGIDPDVDLTGPPEDPGISHAHALLLPQADGGWAVVDLGSANGTYVNDPAKAIPVRAPIAVKPGDKIYAGAWTLLTVT